MAWLDRQPRLAPLLPKGAAASTERLLLQVGLLKPWMLRLFSAPWYSRLLTSIEKRTVPGQILLVGLRKRFMDEETRAALVGGSRQVPSLERGSNLPARRNHLDESPERVDLHRRYLWCPRACRS
ncbi:MAG TPA: hypothetical protein VF794_39745 [Archangium sp.]|uniref:hypothetical protein n=1 Tax=Archangium sp. TaxID=1872627 RepID=UPI002EDA7B8C